MSDDLEIPERRPGIASNTGARRIQRLAPVLANQIAAGEAVERPASVVKELLENSLDAGAQRLRVDVERGGVGLIRVRDDGCGIHGEDLTLALSRHATSKITSLSELEQVRSMGFRGEALPSIASVSRLSIASCSAGDASGTQLQIEGGVVEGAGVPAPHPIGTTVSVRDLFFNTPARRKFLRTEKTEFRHLEDVVKRIALARLDVAVSLEHNGRAVFALPAADAPDAAHSRLARLCGPGFAKHAFAIDAAASGLKLHGWLASPEYLRGKGDLQHFFVNGRMVRDSVARHAVRQAYDGLIPSGMQPAYVLYLEMPPDQVDVNVHPTKHEVRFRETRWVHDFLSRSLRRALTDSHVLEGLEDGQGAEPWAAADTRVDPGAHHPLAAATGGARAGGVREELSAYAALHAGASPAEGVSALAPAATRAPHFGAPLGVVHQHYLLAGTPEHPVVVALPAACEAITRARLQTGLAAGTLKRRPLLLPASVDVGEARVVLAERFTEVFVALGIDLRIVGSGCVSVRQLPSLLAELPAEALVHTALDVLAHAPPVSASPGIERDALLGALIDALAVLAGRTFRLGTAPDAAAKLLLDLESLLVHSDPLPGVWAVLSRETLEQLVLSAQ